jgi:WD40 repeat protein
MVAYIGIESIQIFDLGTSEILDPIFNTGYKSALSPDMQRLAIADEDGDVLTYPIRRCLLEDLPDEPSLVRWSPDQSQLVSTSQAGDLYIWNAATMERIDHVAIEGRIWTMAWSDDGTKIAFIKTPVYPTHLESEWRLHVYDVSNQELIDIAIPRNLVWEDEELEERIEWHMNNQHLLVASSEQVHPDYAYSDTLWIIDTKTGTAVNRFHFPASEELGLGDWRWSPDGTLLGATVGLHSLHLWEFSALVEN